MSAYEKVCEKVQDRNNSRLDFVLCNAYDNHSDEYLEKAAAELAALEAVAEAGDRLYGMFCLIEKDKKNFLAGTDERGNIWGEWENAKGEPIGGKIVAALELYETAKAALRKAQE